MGASETFAHIACSILLRRLPGVRTIRTVAVAWTMPRLPRRFIFDPTEVGIYHCINRCVRRAFLCGTDELTGKCFEHRKVALQNRLEFLAGEFGVDILGFAVMSNHIHVVVRNRPDLVAGWSDDEVARHWWNIFPKRKTAEGTAAEPRDTELQMITADPDRLAEIRRRLSSVPWFMRCLVEPIARQANREDAVSGRFWQGRYFCQKILDEAALAACLAYVDLNPIRAGIAQTPEASQFTSVYERVAALRRPAEGQGSVTAERLLNSGSTVGPIPPDESRHSGPAQSVPQVVPGAVESGAAWLSPFELSAEAMQQPVPSARASNKGCLPMPFAEYLQLLDWTGRQLRSDKRCAIPEDLAPVFERLSLSDCWSPGFSLLCSWNRFPAFGIID